jgi:hypothetical protein
MANGQNDDMFSVVEIEGNVGTLPGLNYPFTVFLRQLFDWTANLRVFSQRLYTLPDCLYGAPGRVLALGS